MVQYNQMYSFPFNNIKLSKEFYLISEIIYNSIGENVDIELSTPHQKLE